MTPNGNITFGEIIFDRAGSYTLNLHEVKGDAENVTYDTNTYQVTVVVTDENGVLTAAVQEPEGGVIFRNKYTEPVKTDEGNGSGGRSDDTPVVSEAVKTGDDSNPALWLALLAAAAGAAGLVMRKRVSGRHGRR